MSLLTSEADVLACIDRHFPNSHSHMVQGRGDDCAILACPGQLSLSSDLFIEDVHFRRRYFSHADIGYKALAVNLSDIAAMGGVPLGFSMGLMIPAGTGGLGQTDWDDFFGGMATLARAHDVALTGGDLSKAPVMGVAITVWAGQAASLTDAESPAPFLRRGTARSGDVIFCVGAVGLARTGLLTLESMGSDAALLYPASVAAHLRPVPRIAEGQALARFSAAQGNVLCLMDLSDGLARDLPRLLGTDSGSGLVAELTIDRATLHEEIAGYCLANDLDPLEEALLGGEDYALVGTCPEASADALKEALPHVQFLGRARTGDVAQLNGMPWQPRGFDHFSQ